MRTPLLFGLVLAGLLPAQKPAATTAFLAAAPILAGGEPLDVGSHATTRCFDWDQDGDLDLLVGGGDGRIWLFLNEGRGTAQFAAGVPITAAQHERWGSGYTGALLCDCDADGLPDLAVAHSSGRVTIHRNVGRRGAPVFGEPMAEVAVQGGCQGRLDAADWNGDGRIDLVTGSFEGALEVHANVGSATAPKFAAAQSLGGLRLAYNAQPRIVDFDADGRLDLLLGLNWGSVTLFRNEGSTAAPKLGAGQDLCWAEDGKPLNLRAMNGDDTTPELADLDGDGVLDLISGGKNGAVFWLRGLGASDRARAISDLLAAAGDDPPRRFEQDLAARNALFGALSGLQADLATGLVQSAMREALFAQLANLAKGCPALLQRRRFDLDATPHAPMLAAQFWVVAKAAAADTPAGRAALADALGFDDGARRLLVDLGVLLYDNSKALPQQLERMHALLMALPRAVWDVELISVADWLGPGRNDHPVRARTAVNIFGMGLGVPENSFPADAGRPGVTDVFLICLAHEIAHNMLDTVGRRSRPELYERKFEGLAFGAGDEVVYREPPSLGIDLDATKARFAKAGLWNGKADDWQAAWQARFDGQDRFDKAYARGNIRFFLEAPQEAFATLANQYVTDSELMLTFAKARWDAGCRSTVHQFLLIADYLSGGGDAAPLYVLARGGELTLSSASLKRDGKGRIASIQTPKASATFRYEPRGRAIVEAFELRPQGP
jgi:hypothetical protein